MDMFPKTLRLSGSFGKESGSQEGEPAFSTGVRLISCIYILSPMSSLYLKASLSEEYLLEDFL